MKKLKIIIITSLLLGFASTISGCATMNKAGDEIASFGRTLSGVGDDNTPPPAPLYSFEPEFNLHPLWTSNPNGGVGKDYLQLGPNYADGRIFTAGVKGLVTATDPATGRVIWHTNTGLLITGGPGVGEGIVVVVGAKGSVVALNENNGSIIWRAFAPNESLSTPAIGEGEVIIKTLDGQLCALSTLDGHTNWLYNHPSPVLIMRNGSAPLIVGHEIITGFSDGKLSALDLNSGRLIWEQTIATPQGASEVEQVVDIVADPVFANGVIYVATYQGNIAAVNFATGEIIWQQAISSYEGIAVGPSLVFITDASGQVWAFNRSNGAIAWQQNGLLNRFPTGPQVIANAIVVADGEGFLHCLAQYDGRFVARVFVGDPHDRFISSPAVVGRYIYALASNGHLSAWYLS